MTPEDEDANWKAAARRRFAIAGALVVAGVVFAALTQDTVRIVGYCVMVVGLTGLVSLVFLEIGLSEDRDRRRNPPGL